MTVIRVSKRECYAVIDRRPMDDPRLCLKERGLLAYLLSKPDSWRAQVKDIANKHRDGEDAIYATLRGLEELGYVRREQVRDPQGRIVRWETIVHEVPFIPDENSDYIGESPNWSPPATTRQKGRSEPLRALPDLANPEHSNNEKTEKEREDLKPLPSPSANGESGRARQPDLLFEALLEAEGLVVGELTTDERGRVNRAAKQLRQVGSSPDEIARLARAHRAIWPDLGVTAKSLAANRQRLLRVDPSAPAGGKRGPYRQPDPSVWDDPDVTNFGSRP